MRGWERRQNDLYRMNDTDTDKAIEELGAALNAAANDSLNPPMSGLRGAKLHCRDGRGMETR